jgi:tetratricopeptide (TPR) repeat protein
MRIAALALLLLDAAPARAGIPERWTAAQQAAQAARDDRVQAARCVELYRALAADDPADAADALYDGAVCANWARDPTDALAMFTEVVDRFPTSPLAPHASFQAGVIDMDLARYDDAAASFEETARLAPTGDDSADALANAAFFRAALGDPDAAERDAELADARYGAKQPELGLRARLAVAGARLERGERGDRTAAARAITTLASRAARSPDPAYIRGVAWLAWNASCPVEPADGLCPRARDHALVRVMRGLLARAQIASEPPIDAALAVETALAIGRPGPKLDRAYRTAADLLDALAAGGDAGAAVAANVQRDRLDAHLARVTGNPERHTARELLPRPADALPPFDFDPY